MPRSKSALLDWVRGTQPVRSASRERCTIDGATIEYTLKRSQHRRRITLTIDDDGLRVGAPWRASQARIDAALLSHGRWIARKLAEWQGRRPPAVTWQAGAVVMALGEPLTLLADAAIKVTTRDGASLLVSEADDAATLAHLVVAWLRDTAQDWFEQRAGHFASVL